MGLFGSIHCVGMCGGIIGTLSMSLSTQVKPKPAPIFWFLLNYNLGRIISYSLAGLLLGLISSVTLSSFSAAHQYSMIISGVFMIAFGLYISQIWMGLSKVEQLASPFWSKIQPLANRFLPPKTPLKAIPLGLVWGWLPCGLVYSALPIAFSAGSPVDAGFVMLAFGLGTFPMLMILGKSAQFFKTKLQKKSVQLTLGGIMIIWGVTQVFGINPLMQHSVNHVMGH